MTRWRSPAELLEHGLGRSRLVLMNEAHSGHRRCVRTREVGCALLPVAHRAGVRHLAMEALWDGAVTERANASRKLEDGLSGYLEQPEMRALVNAALDLGWTLHSYEAAITSASRGAGFNSWRSDRQARNLGAIVAGLPGSARMLCWCGNGHLYRRSGTAVGETWPWAPMGSLVAGYCGVEPFAIDQTITVLWDDEEPDWLAPFADTLRSFGGTAGFVAGEAPEELAWLGTSVDAYLLSLENELVD